MFLIIGIWGGKDRIYATFKFFLYTLLGSILMLVAIIYLINLSGTSDIVALSRFAVSSEDISLLGFSIRGGGANTFMVSIFCKFCH